MAREGGGLDQIDHRSGSYLVGGRRHTERAVFRRHGEQASRVRCCHRLRWRRSRTVQERRACAYEVAKAINPEQVNQYGVIKAIDLAICDNRETVRIGGEDCAMARYKSAINEVLRRSYEAKRSNVHGTEKRWPDSGYAGKEGATRSSLFFV